MGENIVSLLRRISSGWQRPIRPRTMRRTWLEVEELETRFTPAINVLTYHGGLASTGVNATETQLTPANVVVNSFGKIFTQAMDGQVYTQPLIVTGVTITSGPNTTAGATGVHDVVFAATQHDSLYAIDAAATSGTVLWKRSFLDTSVATNNTLGATAITTVSSTDVGIEDISPEIGITGTPVIDGTNGILYVVIKTKETIGGSTHYVQRLHAININNGTDRVTPFLVGDTRLDINNNTPNYFNNTPIYVYGSGDGWVTDPYNGTGQKVIPFNALRQHQRSALSLVNNTLYVNWASHGDNGPYHGWVAKWDVTNLATSGFVLKGVFNTSPNNGLSGIWQGGGRLVFEPDGSAFYFETGNGDTILPQLDANGFPRNANFNNALLKVMADSTTSPTNQNANGWGLKVVDYFIPFNTGALDGADSDFGSGGPMLLPDVPGRPRMMVAGGKEGKLYLLNRDNLGRYDAQNDRVLNAVPDGSGHNTAPVVLDGLASTPAWFNNQLYAVSAYAGQAHAFTVDPSGSQWVLTSRSETTVSTFGYLPGSPTVSANGTSNGIVWIMDRNANRMHAYDAATLATELWHSGQKIGGGDNVGAVVKFAVPTVANGRVYVGTAGGLVVYGVVQSPNAVPLAPTLSASALSGSTVQLNWTDPTAPPNTATSYLIEKSTDGTNFSTATTAPGGTTAITLGGLTPLTKYYFRIKGINSLGSSPSSNVPSVTTTNQALVLDFSSGFANAANLLTRNGSATFNGSMLELTAGRSQEAGSAFANDLVDVTAFTSRFTFQLSPGSSAADGFTFTLQGIGTTALGRPGGDLGFGGIGTKSLAIKFDLYSNAGEGNNSTGLFSGGVSPFNSGSIDLTPSGLNLHSGDVFQVDLIYDGTILKVTITDIQTNKSASQNYTVNIPGIVGNNRALVGFTGGTGDLTAIQDIKTWTYAPGGTASPNAPSGLGATPASGSSVLLSWTNNATNQLGFRLDRADDPNFTHNLITQSLPYQPNSYTDTYPGLAPGGTYYYRLRSYNSVGDSGNSNVAQVTIPQPPPMPTNQKIEGITTTTIGISWQDNAGHLADGYKILRAANHGNFIQVATLPPTSRPAPSTYSWSDENLAPGTFYQYHIIAYNVSGNNDFAGVNATTITQPPSTLSAVAGNSVVNLSWTAPTGAVSYNIYRGTSPGGEGSTPIATGVTASTYSDTAVTNGVTYYYKVTAVNANATRQPPLPAESAASNEASTAGTQTPVLDFSTGFTGSTTKLTYNGSAAINSGKARLTSGLSNQAGSMFSTSAVDITQFTTQFVFQIGAGSNTADGFTFTIQNKAATALGPAGGGLGYGPDSTTTSASNAITSSVAVKFDLYSNQGEGTSSTGLYTNGAAPTNIGSINLLPSIDLHSGHVCQVNMTYNGTTLTVVIKDTATGAAATQNYTVNIPTIVGANTAYVGFTAGTGGLAATQDIQTWTYTPSLQSTQAPAAHTNPLVTSVTMSQIGLSWMDNAGSTATGYQILRGVNQGTFTNYSTLPAATGSPPSTYTWSDTSVSPGTLYSYQIVAYNGSGNSTAAVTSVTTLTAAPTNLTATASNAAVALAWTAPTGAVSYNIYRGTSAGGEGSTPIATGVTTTTYNDTAVTNGVTYYYKVTAVNANATRQPPLPAESAASNEALATPAAQTPLLDFSAGFTGSTTKLTYNGSATINSGKARLTSGLSNQAGSMFSTSTVDVTQFTTQFTFQIGAGSNTADGFTFTIQNQTPTALGPAGGGLGYGPDSTTTSASNAITSSVAIKFDLYSNQGEGTSSTGLYTNGAAPTNVGSINLLPSIDLHSGHIFQVNMTYNGTTLTVVIKDTATGATATQNYTVNIPSIVGANSAYVGFTAGTGGLSATQDILTWTYT